MTREQVVAMAQGMERSFNAHDAAALAANHAEGSVVESPIFGTVRGPAGIQSTYEDFFRAFADSTLETLELVIDGGRLAQLFILTATHTSEMFGVLATNRRFKIQGVLFFELRDGKIIHERRIYDFTNLLVQIGVIKAKPGK